MLLYTIGVAGLSVVSVLALASPHAVRARRRRRARLWQAQRAWAELMERHDSPGR